MSYNKFRWWTKGRRNKPLAENAPIFDKIKNGDFDYSYMFAEAKQMRDTAQSVYQQTYDNYGGTDEKNRIEVALEASRMKRLKAIKLELEAHKDEQKILWKLQKELTYVFGFDIFEEAIEKCDGDLVDLLNYYKKHQRKLNAD